MDNNGFYILQKLSESLQNFPSHKAFYIQGVSYTYRQFQKRISAIQKYILSEIPIDEKYVGIISHDQLDTYASIFALWYSGKAFVPLNPQNPAERTRDIISQMNLKYILYASESGTIKPKAGQVLLNTLNLPDKASEIIRLECSQETDAYVLFTSGSTGHPKGVRINRHNLDAFYNSYLAFGPEYTHDDRFLQIYDITFDGSVPCYLVALCVGATIFTVPQDEIKYLYAFKLMKEQDLTVVKMTPSTLYFLRPYFYLHSPSAARMLNNDLQNC